MMPYVLACMGIGNGDTATTSVSAYKRHKHRCLYQGVFAFGVKLGIGQLLNSAHRSRLELNDRSLLSAAKQPLHRNGLRDCKSPEVDII